MTVEPYTAEETFACQCCEAIIRTGEQFVKVPIVLVRDDDGLPLIVMAWHCVKCLIHPIELVHHAR